MIKKLNFWYDKHAIKNANRVYKWEWAILIAFALAMLCTSIYNDILITSRQSLIFLDCVASGKPMSFFLEAFNSVTGVATYNVPQSASYPITFYVIFAVWNLPLWLIQRFTGKDVLISIPGMIWIQLILVLAVFLALREFYLILKDNEKTKNYAELGCFLFASSALVLVSVFIMGGYEIMTIFIMLAAIRAWLKDDWKKFLIFSMIAVSLKYFALLYFVPLVLLKEKRFFRIIGMGIASVLLSLVSMVFPKPKASTPLTLKLLKVFTNDAAVKLGEERCLQIFVIVVIIAFMWAFITKPKKEEELHYAVFFLMIIMGAFTTFADIHYYWSVLAVPVLIMAILLSSGNMNKSLILETVAVGAYTVKSFLMRGSMTRIELFTTMKIIPKIFNLNVPLFEVDDSLAFKLERMEMKTLFVLVSFLEAVTICCIFAMIYLCKPGRKKIDVLEPLNGFVVKGRAIANMGLTLVPMAFYVLYFIFIYES